MRDDSSSTGTTRGNGGGGGGRGGNEPRPVASKFGWFTMRFGVDHANRELRVCMTRAVAGVSVAGFCGLLIGVVALSRNASNNGPQSARAAAVSSIIDPAAEENLPRVAPPKRAPAARPVSKPRPAQLQTSAKPLVATNVPVKTPAAPALTPAKTRAMPTTSTTPDILNKPSVALASGPAVVIKTAEARTVGHNYLVFGSYPTHAEAKRVTQKLRTDGVACTIERSLPGWTKKGWYSVVGVKGYETTKTPAYQSEVKSLENLGLEPRAYRWRNTGGA